MSKQTAKDNEAGTFAKHAGKTDAAAAPAGENAKADEKPSTRHVHATARAEKPKRHRDPNLKRRILIGLAIVAAIVIMLYRPTRDYYIAWRTGYTLNYRYEALAEENEQLNDDLERLMTREGIEDAARERGFVMPGETSVKVEGLDEEVGEESSAKASDLTGEEELPWFIRVGDAIFFYRSDS